MPPQLAALTSSNKLSLMRNRFDCCAELMSSWPIMFTADETWRTMLCVNVTSWTIDHGALPSWLRTVNTMEKPACALGQLCSKMFPSIRIRCAFLSSKMFFTVHEELCQEVGLKK